MNVYEEFEQVKLKKKQVEDEYKSVLRKATVQYLKDQFEKYGFAENCRFEYHRPQLNGSVSIEKYQLGVIDEIAEHHISNRSYGYDCSFILVYPIRKNGEASKKYNTFFLGDLKDCHRID